MSSLLHPYTPSLCLPQTPLSTSYQHCFCLLWFSTCWPFSLAFPPSSSQIYQLLHGLQIQSKNSPFLQYKHLWLLTNSNQALKIRHNHVDLCALKLYYVMLCFTVLSYLVCIHLGYLMTDISDINQASLFHLIYISLSFPSFHACHFLFYLNCKCLWISSH